MGSDHRSTITKHFNFLLTVRTLSILCPCLHLSGLRGHSAAKSGSALAASAAVVLVAGISMIAVRRSRMFARKPACLCHCLDHVCCVSFAA